MSERIYRMRVYDKDSREVDQTLLFDTVEELLTVAQIYSKSSDVYFEFDSAECVFNPINTDAE